MLQKLPIQQDRILSIQQISDFGKSVRFHRIRNPWDSQSIASL